MIGSMGHKPRNNILRPVFGRIRSVGAGSQLLYASQYIAELDHSHVDPTPVPDLLLMAAVMQVSPIPAYEICSDTLRVFLVTPPLKRSGRRFRGSSGRLRRFSRRFTGFRKLRRFRGGKLRIYRGSGRCRRITRRFRGGSGRLRRISRFRVSSGKSRGSSRRVVRGLVVVVVGLGGQEEYLNRRNWLIFLLRSAHTATWPPRTQLRNAVE
jgi:hypothetical protein